MKKFATASAVFALVLGILAIGSFLAVAQVNGNDNNLAFVDDCLPTDAAYNDFGGCPLKPHQGDVPLAEFFALLTTPLSNPPNGQLIGHPSWRTEPSHQTARAGRTVRVVNKGGREHTFAEVTNFGGGFVPLLNIGLNPAPECTPGNATPLLPGATVKLTGLAPGLHRYQCCIHPWMRATIRVQ